MAFILKKVKNNFEIEIFFIKSPHQIIAQK